MTSARFQYELEQLEQIGGIRLYGDPQRIEELAWVTQVSGGAVLYRSSEIGLIYSTKPAPVYRAEERKPVTNIRRWLWLVIGCLLVLEAARLWEMWRG